LFRFMCSNQISLISTGEITPELIIHKISHISTRNSTPDLIVVTNPRVSII